MQVVGLDGELAPDVLCAMAWDDALNPHDHAGRSAGWDSQYFASHGVDAFYPRVIIEFETAPGEAHYHVPLLLNAFGYTTYRGT